VGTGSGSSGIHTTGWSASGPGSASVITATAYADAPEEGIRTGQLGVLRRV